MSCIVSFELERGKVRKMQGDVAKKQDGRMMRRITTIMADRVEREGG
jgi:hypothetical protein